MLIRFTLLCLRMSVSVERVVISRCVNSRRRHFQHIAPDKSSFVYSSKCDVMNMFPTVIDCTVWYGCDVSDAKHVDTSTFCIFSASIFTISIEKKRYLHCFPKQTSPPKPVANSRINRQFHGPSLVSLFTATPQTGQALLRLRNSPNSPEHQVMQLHVLVFDWLSEMRLVSAERRQVTNHNLALFFCVQLSLYVVQVINQHFCVQYMQNAYK